MAGLDEVLVGLRLVEAADDGPDGVRRRVDALREDGGALARGEGVGVLVDDGGFEVVELLRGEAGREGEVVAGRVLGLGCRLGV